MLEKVTDTVLTPELVTYALTGTLHALNCDKPYVTFLLSAGQAQYYAPVEYAVPVPLTIEWPYFSVGEFTVDLIATFNADSLEVISLDDVRPNPDLEGGF